MAATSFLCKFCHAVQIYFDESTGEFTEVETGIKHRCKKPDDFANVVKVLPYAGEKACRFCHTTNDSRAVFFYKDTIEPASSMMIICFDCLKRGFYILQGDH